MDVHELTPAYALHALDAEEREAFEAHLAQCERCREELAVLGESAAALAWAVESPAPPPALRAQILAAATERLRRGGQVSAEVVDDFLRQTRQSTALLDAYARRCEEFDACVVGPYGNGLTWEALRIHSKRTLLMPCFHREALAQRLAPAFAQ